MQHNSIAEISYQQPFDQDLQFVFEHQLNILKGIVQSYLISMQKGLVKYYNSYNNLFGFQFLHIL